MPLKDSARCDRLMLGKSSVSGTATPTFRYERKMGGASLPFTILGNRMLRLCVGCLAINQFTNPSDLKLLEVPHTVL
jgi:hypothetical protein